MAYQSHKIDRFRTLAAILVISVALFLIESSSADAQSVYHVRKSATGSNNGLDWQNAFTALPASLQRGATYFLAAGTYGGYTFDDEVSGQNYIYIKKATAANHGTDIGWSASYASEVAKFAGSLEINSSFIDIDGVTGSIVNGIKVSQYGIEIQPVSPSDVLRFGPNVTNVNLKHIDAHNYPEGTAKDDMVSFNMILKATGGTANIYVGHSYFHDTHGCFFQYVGANGWTLEHNYFSRNRSTAEWHAGGMCDHSSDNMTVRYNVWEDIDGSAVFDLISGPDIANNWQIYGNVFWHTPTYGAGLAAIIGVWDDASNSRTATNWKVYNNTILNISGIDSMYFASAATSNVDIKNNYWYCNRQDDSYSSYVYISGSGVSYDYNFYSACAHPGSFQPGPHEPTLYWGPNCQLSSSNTNPFSSWPSGNFHLSSPTTPGYPLASPFNVDIEGKTRGADGVWDRGAYEFNGNSVEMFPPARLRTVN